jgi:hypothetical protein
VAVRIDKRLNLVFPLGDEGTALQVHSTPISREIYERYWAVINRALTYAFASAGTRASRIASLALKDVSEQTDVWEDKKQPNGDIKPGVKNGLLAEIRRLTNVIVYDATNGWGTIPLDVAAQQGKLDADEQTEVESAIVFFTLASWGMDKTDLAEFAKTTGFGIRKAQTTSSNSTEWARSLPTSTETASSGKKADSLVPS